MAGTDRWSGPAPDRLVANLIALTKDQRRVANRR